MLESLTPRYAAAVGLLALVPTIVYGVVHPGLSGFVAALNVVLIFLALAIALSPIGEADHGPDSTA
ncbi:cytochrome-ba3 oxidase subunit [Natrarchaeobius chitinivorans]|uniref:Cytochrome-ba3 oxidase subunit n=1 Tax=Natrarchaeobius chitinivorans TaxID=1679083 RepID=A0A3N6LYM3_NATCH|nr:cytochrome-ba3 oxidase subunit [Natrarchaeobius chitinivorans]RQG94197.1 cytochrome-ba3 oxidase subunit [Natrarchaeobius chitinivorans]